jgi:hypothetical protein
VIGRLLLGLLKGLVIGALVGYGLAVAGIGWPFMFYVGASMVGAMVALVAGKPIWAKDARIEVGMKALAGAILAPGLMWLVRSFVSVGLPFDVAMLPGLGALQSQGMTLGTFSVSALAMVAAMLGGFYDADNAVGDSGEAGARVAATKKKRVADGETAAIEEAAEAEAIEAEAQQQKKRRS